MLIKSKSLSVLALSAAIASGSAFAGNEETNRTWMTDAGDGVQIAVPLFALGYAAFQGDTEGFWQAAEGALYTSLATHALKNTVNAERPNGNDNKSFPSGHTSAAMQGAAFLTMRYGWEVGLPATAAAAFVGYSRVDANYHYTRDVVAGTALAWGVQYAITEMGFSPTKYIIAPFVSDDGGFGLSFSGDF